MRSLHHWMAAILVALPLSVRAAEEDKYLLNDTHLLMTVDVQQVRKSPFFVKNFQQQAEQFLKAGPIQEELKKAGLDPLQDVDRLVVVMGLSSHREDVRIEGQASLISASGFPLLLIQGRFDPDKLHAWAMEQAKASGMVKLHQSDAGRYYQIVGRADQQILFAGYVAVLDKGLVVLCSHKDQIEEILAKKTGKKETQLKGPAMKALLAQRDPKLAVQILACKDMVVSTSTRSFSMNGQTVTEIKRSTLGDAGFETLAAGISVNGDLQGQFTLTAQKPDLAAKFAKEVDQKLKAIAAEVGQEKELAPLVDALKSIQISRKDRQVTVEGKAKAEAVMEILLGYYRHQNGSD